MFAAGKSVQLAGKVFKTFQLMFATCWNCNESLNDSKIHFFCSKCDKIQKVEPNVNYYSLLKMGDSMTYDIDKKKLSEHYHNLQKLMHPDRFSNKGTDEQNISEECSTVVNAAFKTLKSDSKRAWYLLSLKENGNQLPLQSTPDNAEFLKEIMEWNERVDQLHQRPQEMHNCLDSISSNIRKLWFFYEGKVCFLSLNGAKTTMEKDFRIKLIAFESLKTQYYCDQILSKTKKFFISLVLFLGYLTVKKVRQEKGKR